MNNIKALCVLAGMILNFSSFGQGPEIPAIRERLIAFMELTNNNAYSEAFDYTYPRMFTLVSKEEMVDAMMTVNQNGLSISTKNAVIDSFSFPFIEGNETFVRIKYAANLNVDLITGSMFDTPEMYDSMRGQLESVYGKEYVKWNIEDKSFDVVVKTSMIAIRQDGGEWYLVEIRPDQMDLMKALFSEAVIKKFITAE